jgi:hypothetical protein
MLAGGYGLDCGRDCLIIVPDGSEVPILQSSEGAGPMNTLDYPEVRGDG